MGESLVLVGFTSNHSRILFKARVTGYLLVFNIHHIVIIPPICHQDGN